MAQPGPGRPLRPRPRVAPAPVSERLLPGYLARLATTRRAARPGGRAPAGSPNAGSVCNDAGTKLLL